MRPVRRVPRPAAADPLEEFSEAEVRECLAYAKPRERWGLAALAVDLALLGLLALSPPGQALVAWAAGLAGRGLPGRAALAAAAVFVVQALAGFPFRYRAYCQDVRAGLTTQRPAAFLLDWAKASAVQAVLLVVPVAALIVAAAWRPPGWPWAAALVAAGLVVALSLLAPVVLEPLFNRFTPMPAGRLRERVLALASRMGLAAADVLVADASRRTRKVNAYVSGLGRTRRVVLYDTLASMAGEDEVLLVLAHELAHVRHRDVAISTAAGAVAAAAGVLGAAWLFGTGAARSAFAVTGLGDPRVTPALLLVAALAGLAVAPLASAASRFAEARADWAALELCRDPDAAIAVERRLALQNRADLRPNRLLVALFASHPPTMARIAQARLWALHAGGALGDAR